LTDWGVFSTVAGGATAALLGLLFVAVSIRAEFIARSVELRNRATQTGILFLTGLLASLLLVIPEQERWLGLEFLALGGVTGATVLALDRRAARDTTGSRAGHFASSGRSRPALLSKIGRPPELRAASPGAIAAPPSSSWGGQTG
jgi:hypothetical protein